MTDKEKLKEVEDQMHHVYLERNKLVALLSTFYPSHLYDDPAEPDWPIVCIHSPEGLLSWHFHKGHVKTLFGHLKFTVNDWDGHTTEEKYLRIEKLKSLSN